MSNAYLLSLHLPLLNIWSPGSLPSYASQVIFARRTFIEGSTAELSADGPLRPPYVVYC